jgi:hypothetical protein
VYVAGAYQAETPGFTVQPKRNVTQIDFSNKLDKAEVCYQCESAIADSSKVIECEHCHMLYHKECAKSQLMLTKGGEDEVNEAPFCCESCFLGLRRCNLCFMTAGDLQAIKIGSQYLYFHAACAKQSSIRECDKCEKSILDR